jgi:penicillin amidase
MKNRPGVSKVTSASHSRFGFIASLSALLLAALPATVHSAGASPDLSIDPPSLARTVTIHRDRYGVPHIDGPTDISVIFGFGYCQAEDYLWQIEESYVGGLGRASELNGDETYKADWNNRLFEVPRLAREDFEKLDPKSRAMCAAYVAGLNFYLEKHPGVKLRLLERFEPWYLLAFGRNVLLQTIYHAPSGRNSSLAQNESDEAELLGSNAYAIGPSRTRDGSTMLYANPHQPYYGFGQFYEAHVRSAEGLNFSGATFFGSPLPSIGHNEHLGWTCTVNTPMTGNAWLETFDDPANPLNYKYGDGYRTATEWQDTIKVKTAKGCTERKVTFRKTHHGPIADTINGHQQVAVNIARFREAFFPRQSLQMLKARNLAEFLAAMEHLEQHIYNVVYADRFGNILYLYNGIVPRRDPAFDWEKPLDGSNPRTEWNGCHALGELPRVLNPISGFVQNCNQTPFTTTDDGNPFPGDFPAYMIHEKERNDDKRRAKVARYLLRNLRGVTFEQWQTVCLDTTMYWAITELPKYKDEFARLKQTDPDLARQVEPYLTHLLDWDGRGGENSTQATLCTQWYVQLAGPGFATHENLRPEFINDPAARFKALVTAAETLKKVYGDWKVPWGDVHRLQRYPDVAELARVPFSDALPSLPTAGVPGTLGAAFTQYYTPPVPGVSTRRKQYGVVGNSFMGVYEFAKDFVRAKTLLQYGESSNPASPHFFDQARLLSQGKFKESPFEWNEVLAQATRTYHPGETTSSQ